MSVKHAFFDSLLVSYTLGTLSPQERQRLRRHLDTGCPLCVRRVEGYRAVALALGQSVEPRSPRPELKRLLLERLGPSPTPVWRLSWGWPVAAAAALVLALLVGRFWPDWISAPQAPGLALSGTAEALSLRSGALLADGRPMTVGAGLAWDATLSTGPVGPAEIQVGRRAVFLLQPGTRLRVHRDGEGLWLDLPHGTVFSAVVPGTPCSVRAGGVRVDTRGTLFLVRQVRADQAYVCICRGRIRVRAPGLDRDLASRNDAGEKGLILALDGAGTQATAAKPAYYSDAQEDQLQDALKDLAGLPRAREEKPKKDRDDD